MLRKDRFGDRNVRVIVPDLRQFRKRTPILIDDIVSSGQTMIEAAQQLRAQLSAPTCIAVHALLSAAAYRALKDVAGRVVSTNAVLRESNGIEISDLLAGAAADLLAGSENGD